MPRMASLNYRPEIDGLRAVAVVPVVLYHAGLGFPGGYTGVDVFFVISGFLITSLIWKDLEAGRFTLLGFWERRARRIVPALAVMVLATLAAGWFLLLPAEYASLGWSAASQAVFLANVFFWRDSGYFSDAAHEKPLLHTWSLAVEEQFYLIVPWVLWALYRLFSQSRQRAVVVALVGASAVSLAMSIYGVARHPSAAFYLLPTRAWELLCGSIVAFMPAPSWPADRRAVRETLAAIGLTLIVAPMLVYSSTTPFPGLAAVPSCLGTALVIWVAAPRGGGGVPTAVEKGLALRPMVYVGLISYSLYLWHWPLLAFDAYLSATEVESSRRYLLPLCAWLLAHLSWRYVETPFRDRRYGLTRRTVFAAAGAGLASVFVLGLVCGTQQGFPARVSPQANAAAAAKFDMSFIHELTPDDIVQGRLVPLGSPTGGRPRVLAWGDSHAMAAMPAVDAWLAEQGLAGWAATHSATTPVLDWYDGAGGLFAEAPHFNRAVLEFVRREKIGDILLIARWNRAISKNRSDGDPSLTFGAALLSTVRELVAAGAQPWILLDVPDPLFDVPRRLSHPLYEHGTLSALGSPVETRNEFDVYDPQLRGAVEAAGGRFIDPKPRFVDASGTCYVIELDDTPLYRDRHHLSTKGAKLMLLPVLRDAIRLAKP